MKPTRLTLVLAISTLLFLCNTGRSRKFYPKKISPLIKTHFKIMKGIQSKRNFALTRAFIIGDKRSLTKKLRNDYKVLNINHLFTPSGIHFSSFFILFLPLLKRLRKKGYRVISFLLELSLCLLPFGLNQFYSLKRISLLRIAGLSFRPFKISIDYFYLFLASFIFDFFFGTFIHSPLSFSFSFLFLGTLLSSNQTSSLLVSFLVANLFVSFFFYQSVNILGFLFGFFITAFFSSIFPIIFILYWPSSLLNIDLSSPFVNCISFLVRSSAEVSRFFPSIELCMIGMILLFIFSINRRAIFLIIAILISSCRLYNIPQSRFRSQNIQSSEILKGGFIKNGKQIFIDKRKKCTRRIILNGHQINCRYTDPK